MNHYKLYTSQTTHSHRSTSGQSLSFLIASKGLVYLKRQVRHTKYDPFVEKMEILLEFAHMVH